MLALVVEAAGAVYALDARTIDEVAPLAELRAVPHVPAWLTGLLRCRGALLPVVDLSVLLGGAATPARMSTRIVIDAVPIGGVTRKVGLLVSRALDVVSCGDAAFATIDVAGAPYLGGVVEVDGRSAQIVRTASILPSELARMLYDATESPLGA